VPGPLFTFAAYLGAVIGGPGTAALCLVAVFLPSFLLVIGALPFWNEIRSKAKAQAALQGVNAAVVGLLLAALYHPVWTAGITSAKDFALASVAFLLLYVWHTTPWLVVVLSAVGASMLAWLPSSMF
jgi:chromate transporter